VIFLLPATGPVILPLISMVGLRGVSSWWSTLSLLGGDKEATVDWFSDGVARVVGDGLSTHFWHDPWCGPTILRVRFRRLFQLSLQVDHKVEELGHWEGDAWVWDFIWRRPLFVWESDLLFDLLVVATRPTRVDREDTWSWINSPDGRYSVKSAYSILSKGLVPEGIPRGLSCKRFLMCGNLGPRLKLLSSRGNSFLIGYPRGVILLGAVFRFLWVGWVVPSVMPLRNRLCISSFLAIIFSRCGMR
jgi:hypothetical protein